MEHFRRCGTELATAEKRPKLDYIRRICQYFYSLLSLPSCSMTSTTVIILSFALASEFPVRLIVAVFLLSAASILFNLRSVALQNLSELRAFARRISLHVSGNRNLREQSGTLRLAESSDEVLARHGKQLLGIEAEELDMDSGQF